mmetsp:Transcript_10967/g.38047  ORF Transcript_10967/g.38047 Transcript_10967/m.38047 type:complete len:337 (+) Transcript_10967:267-1277(+)
MDGSEEGYAVRGRLGGGAFGEVLLATQLSTGRAVALKRVTLRRPSDGLPDVVLREAKCLERCAGHPNVVQVLAKFAMGSAVAIALELCDTDLGALLLSGAGRIPEAAVKGLAVQLVAGVAHMHARGVLHRDLKPSNVLLTCGGVVKVADFGLARLAAAEGGDMSHEVATRWYRAPELLYGARRYGAGVDMWAVGAIVAELLGGGPLLPGETDIHQLYLVTELLGTPDEVSWPGLKDLPDYGKITFAQAPGEPLESRLPDASPQALQLLSRLLVYDASRRLAAGSALQEDFFASYPLPMQPEELAGALSLPPDAADPLQLCLERGNPPLPGEGAAAG